MMALAAKDLLRKLWNALRVDEGAMSACSFAFSKAKPAGGEWRCFSADLALPFWHISAPGGKQTEIKKLVSGIAADNFMLTADMGDASLLVVKTYGKGKGEKALFRVLRKAAEFDEAANVLSRYDFKNDELTAHASLQAAKELLQRSVGDVFINKGLLAPRCFLWVALNPEVGPELSPNFQDTTIWEKTNANRRIGLNHCEAVSTELISIS